MPVTLWGDIPKRDICDVPKCTNYVIYYYGEALIYCQCHDEEGGGLVSQEEARLYHEQYAF